MVMGSLRQSAQVVVIGAGPGGYVAALRAADLGLEVVLVDERERPGGTCLLEGCIPSKALIHAVGVADAARRGKLFGVIVEGLRFDIERMRAFKEEVVRRLSNGVTALLKKRGIEVIRGRANFDGPHSLAVVGSDVSGIDFRYAIIAVGSRAVVPRGLEGAWTSREALDIPEVPERLLIVGGGYVGLELGSVFAGLGSRVTVAEMASSLLPGVDSDISNFLYKRYSQLFEAIYLETRVASAQRRNDAFTVKLETRGEQREEYFDRILVAVGRKPNTDDLGLESASVRTDERGFVPVDDQRRTNVPHIFAIGDVTLGPMLAHKASREGKVAAEVIAGRPSAFDVRAIPAAAFTDPEVAWTGISEREAQQEGRRFSVTRFPLTALGRAWTVGETDGFVKVIHDPDSGLVLGQAIVSPVASELIAEGTLAVEMGATLEDIAATIHPHPTFSELTLEVAEAAAGWPVHVHRS